MSHYKYTVITRENAAECEMAPQFWENHPDWNYFIRTNHRWPGKPGVWISGGGATLAEAIKSAEFGLRQLIFPSVQTSVLPTGVILMKEGETPLVGEESETIIKNR
jgi:hypothetical protein